MALTEEQRAKLNAKAQERENKAESNEMSVEFSQALFFPWIKGMIRVARDQRLIQIRFRNTILGVIPAGERTESIRMNDVSAVNMYRKYRVGFIILGAVCLLIALVMLLRRDMPMFGRVCMWVLNVVLGIVFLQGGFHTGVEIHRISDPSNTFWLYVPFYDMDAVRVIKEYVEDALVRVEERNDVEHAANIIADSLKDLKNQQ